MKEGWIDPRKFPPGHMVFKADSQEGVVISRGRPYALNGMPLPADVSWLRKNNYSVTGDVIRALAPPEPEKKTTVCDRCLQNVPRGCKYCPECGNPMSVIWTPGAGGDGERLRKLIDPEDPLGALDAVSDPLDPEALALRRKTAEEMEATEDEILRELEDVRDANLIAVPGEAARPAKPKFTRTVKGKVSHSSPAQRGG